MATPLDMSLLANFSGLFLFIMIFAITYAVLGLTKVLGDNKTIQATVAFCFGLFMALASKPSQIVENMVPWVGLVIIVIMFLMLTMRFMFGEKGDDMLISAIGGSSKTSAAMWIFIAIMFILLVSFSSVVGPEVTPGSNTTSDTTASSGATSTSTTTGSTETGNWQSNVLNTIYHPKVLGTVLVLFIMVIAIKQLSTVTSPK